jgi:hypothetical protein
MINKNKYFLLGIVLCFFMSSLFIMINGCFSEYKKTTINESGLSFSFEYTSSFNKPDITSMSSAFTDIILDRYAPEGNNHEIEERIQITIWKQSNFPNATAYLEYSIQSLQAYWGEFKLLERTPITLSGIPCEMISYSGYFQPFDFAFNHFLVLDVLLDYKGMILDITLTSNADAQEDRHKSDFEHLIESFKFLD